MKNQFRNQTQFGKFIHETADFIGTSDERVYEMFFLWRLMQQLGNNDNWSKAQFKDFAYKNRFENHESCINLYTSLESQTIIDKLKSITSDEQPKITVMDEDIDGRIKLFSIHDNDVHYLHINLNPKSILKQENPYSVCIPPLEEYFAQKLFDILISRENTSLETFYEIWQLAKNNYVPNSVEKYFGSLMQQVSEVPNTDFINEYFMMDYNFITMWESIPKNPEDEGIDFHTVVNATKSLLDKQLRTFNNTISNKNGISRSKTRSKKEDNRKYK